MRPALVAVPLGIALFFAGVWIGHRTAAAEATHPALPAPGSGSPSHDQDVARSIAALADQIQALGEQIGSRSTASETRVPADGSPSELAEITQMIKDLTERLDSMRGSAGLASGGSDSLRDPDKAPGFASREEMLRDLDQLFSLGPVQPGDPGYEAWSSAKVETSKRWQRMHFLWSPGQLLERYGRPDAIDEAEWGLVFRYTHTSPSGRIVGCMFMLRNGLVYNGDQYTSER